MSLLTYGAITSLQKKINGLGMENVREGIYIISKNKEMIDRILDSISRKKYVNGKNIIGYINIGKKYSRFWAENKIGEIAEESSIGKPRNERDIEGDER